MISFAALLSRPSLSWPFYFSILLAASGRFPAGPRAFGQPIDPDRYAAMRWRLTGPFRGGRTVAVTGIPGEPNVFYISSVNGGVWNNTDYGQVRRPIFDHESNGSIGAIAVAPADPNIIYAGSGEGSQRPDLSTLRSARAA
jgi:hypothetical protein